MTDNLADTVLPPTPVTGGHVLTVVIPALDEEEAIGATIRRCLDAEEDICDVGGVDAVEIIVVSDGSTDESRDVARVLRFPVPERPAPLRRTGT